MSNSTVDPWPPREPEGGGGGPSVAPSETTRRAIRRALIAGTGALLLFAFPSGRSLWNPDEPREAEIGREMALTGDYVVPHLNGQPFLEKPPLYAWMEVAIFKITGGPSAWGARFPSSVCGSVTVALTTLAGEVWLAAGEAGGVSGGGCGLIAGAILATCPLFFWHSSQANLDVPLTLFMMLALMGLELRRPVAGAIAAALAFLAKGFVGPVLVGMVWIARLAWDGDLEQLRRLPWLRMIAAFALPVLPWLSAFAAREHGQFLYAFVVTHHLYRYAHGFDHLKPWYHYFIRLPEGTLPWALGLIVFARLMGQASGPGKPGQGFQEPVGSRLRLLACWIVVPFVFFSLAQSKRDLYLLPSYPAVALAVAWAMAGRPRLLRYTAGVMLLAALVVQAIGFRWVDPLKTITPLIEEAKGLGLPLYGYDLAESDLGIITFALGHPIVVATKPGELGPGKIAVLVQESKAGSLRDAMPLRERKRYRVGSAEFLLLIRDATPGAAIQAPH